MQTLTHYASIGALLAAGCALETPAAAPTDIQEQSGTRLKIEWWELASGELQVRGIYDTQRAADCTFQSARDGSFWCGDVRATLDHEPSAMRVVPTSLRSEDGLVWPRGLFDNERDVECVPAMTTTGELRCAAYNADVTADDPMLAIANGAGDRLAPRLVTSADGLRQHVPQFYDRELAVTCSVSDPLALCLPLGTPTFPLDAYVAAIPTVDP